MNAFDREPDINKELVDGWTLGSKDMDWAFEWKRMSSPFTKESDFEKWFIEQMSFICECIGAPPPRSIQPQKTFMYGTTRCRVDVYVIHEDGTGSIFEAKHNDTPYNQARAVGQLLHYKEAARHSTGQNVGAYLVDIEIHDLTYLTVAEYDLPISLIEMQGRIIFCPRIIGRITE